MSKNILDCDCMSPLLVATLYHKAKEYNSPQMFAMTEVSHILTKGYTKLKVTSNNHYKNPSPGANLFEPKVNPLENDKNSSSVEPPISDPELITPYGANLFKNFTFTYGEDETCTLGELIHQFEILWHVRNDPFPEFLALLGLSMIDFANRCCIPAETMYDWATGKSDILPYIRFLMAKTVGIL